MTSTEPTDAGQGPDTEESGEGRAFGSDSGTGVQAAGIYEVRHGAIDWRPVVDVDRIVERGRAPAGIIAVCAAILLWRRW